MLGTIKIGKIGGIVVEIHITFVFIVLWAAWQGALRYGGPAGAAYGTALILLLFACVFMHELGHSLQAKALGVGVQRITLLPIGGLARLESMHDNPRKELLITLAGPAVNLGLALLLGLCSLALGRTPFAISNLADWADPQRSFLDSSLFFLMGANLSLFLFNMLPAFPMDGGRVVRALLALLIDYELATRLAATLGRLIALGLAGVGILGLRQFGVPPNPLLALIAIMVYAGATQEAAYVRRREALSRIVVGQIANRLGQPLRPGDPITPALATTLLSRQATVPVAVDSRLIGLLTPKELGIGVRLPGPAYVAHVMRTDFPVLNIGETVWTALEVLAAHKLQAVPVVHNGVLQGMLSLEDINRIWRRPDHKRKQLRAAPISGG